MEWLDFYRYTVAVLSFSAFVGSVAVLGRGLYMRHTHHDPFSRRRAATIISGAWTCALATGGAAYGRTYDTILNAPLSWRDVVAGALAVSVIATMGLVVGLRFPAKDLELAHADQEFPGRDTL